MRTLPNHLAIPFATLLMITGSAAQACAQAAPPDKSPTAPVTTYVDLPIEQLKKQIPTLAGLQSDPSQEDLPYILQSVAIAIGETVPQLPDLVSREEVYRSQRQWGPEAPRNMIGMAAAGGVQAGIVLREQGVRGQEYHYLILCHHTSTGISVEEGRTDIQGHALDASRAETNPLGSGFAYQWLLFSGPNQPEFRFHYLGQQQIEGRKTDVVAFAQIPGNVRIPAVFQSRGKQASYYYQGILWIDQENHQIVLLRSDLQAPLRNMQLDTLTTELHFRSVKLRDYDSELWLPSYVHMSIFQGKFDIEEEHAYSDYHLYHSTATIVPVK
jgi:hypothetical protein